MLIPSILITSQVEHCMPIIPALGRQRQSDLCICEASLVIWSTESSTASGQSYTNKQTNKQTLLEKPKQTKQKANIVYFITA